MIRIIFLTLIVLCVQLGEVSAQVIRKNYREMTSAERQIFVNALIEARRTFIVQEYANNHSALFSYGMHSQGSYMEDFLSWHRWYILYFEKALQNTNVTGANKITLPYWDWTSNYYLSSPTDRSSTAPLWDSNFLGQFDSPWSLGRTFGGDLSVPSSVLNSVLSNINFRDFSLALEGNPHSTPHGWVGGLMGGVTSPNDPVFYLHHNMVDKVWQDWHNLGNTTSFADENITLPNRPANIPQFPSNAPQTVSPSSLIDSRTSSVKVWFAENGKVILDKYTASGTENYYYTGVVEAGSRVVRSVVIGSRTINYSTGNFIVPSGTTCNFVSGGLKMGSAPEAGRIRLVPGFEAKAGSNFTAKINASYFTDAASGARIASFESPAENQRLINTEESVEVYPNPSSGDFNVILHNKQMGAYQFKINTLYGMNVSDGKFTDETSRINLSWIKAGVYILTIKDTKGKVSTHIISIN